MPNNRVRIAYTIATFIYHEASNLVRHGLGEDLHGNEIPSFPPELDNIPDDTQTFRWADSCVRFIRYVAQVLAVALEDVQNNEPMITNGDPDANVLGELDININDTEIF